MLRSLLALLLPAHVTDASSAEAGFAGFTPAPEISTAARVDTDDRPHVSSAESGLMIA